MNIAMICRILGLALGVEAAFMTPPFIIALVRGEHSAAVAFAAAITAILVCAVLLRRVKARRQKYYAGEGFVTVGLSWVLLSVFGALPLCLSGSVPSFVDAFFETVSGFTTTGASVIADVEALPMSLQYWRSFTIWLGGMGVLVFVLAVSPMANGDSGDALHLLRAESPGVNVGKLVPRMRRSTTILYLIYIGLTVSMFVLLLFDMPCFDALTTAFATAGTGGFSIRNIGMSAYNPYSQTVMTVFMVLFSMNFTIYYLVLIGKLRQALRSEEMWVFLGILAVASLFIAVNSLPIFGSFGEAFRHAAFTAASIMSTSGFSISDFNLWPWASKTLLVMLMCRLDRRRHQDRARHNRRKARPSGRAARHSPAADQMHPCRRRTARRGYLQLRFRFSARIRPALCCARAAARAGGAGLYHNVFRGGELL